MEGFTAVTDKGDELAATLATEIVKAYLATNSIPAADLPKLVLDLREALSGQSSEVRPMSNAAASDTELKVLGSAPTPNVRPAVPPERSVFPDHLISLEDGARYRSLRRHLRVKYGLTPDEYRAKWGLPPDYPMVAPDYAKERSEVAKRTGLGRNKRLKELDTPRPEPRRKAARVKA